MKTYKINSSVETLYIEAENRNRANIIAIQQLRQGYGNEFTIGRIKDVTPRNRSGVFMRKVA